MRQQRGSDMDQGSRNGPSTLPQDEQFVNSACYQALREKERLVKEYKFKYETTKTLYEELLNVLIGMNDNRSTLEGLSRQAFSGVYNYLDEELSMMQVKRSEVARIKAAVMEKIERVVGQYTKTSGSSENWSSPKLIRPDSMIDTHTGRVSSENDSMHSETLIGAGPKDVNSKPFGARKPIGFADSARAQSNLTSFKEYLMVKDANSPGSWNLRLENNPPREKIKVPEGLDNVSHRSLGSASLPKGVPQLPLGS